MTTSTWRARATPTLLLKYGVLIALALIILGPVLTAILGGFKTTGEVYAQPLSIPTSPRWEYYANILSSPVFWQQLLNSGVIVLGTISLTAITSTLLAFIFSR